MYILMIFITTMPMRKLFVAGIVSLLFTALALPVAAESYEQQTSVGNLYVAQENYTLSDDVSGDAVIAGGDITINGDIGNNLLVAGGNVVVNGVVSDDIFVLGGGVIINGMVFGDVRIIGGTVYINAPSIGGDLTAMTGSLTLDSATQIGGESFVRSGSFITNGSDNPTTIDQLRNITGVYYGLKDDNLKDFFQIGAALSVISVIFAVLYFLGGYLAQLFVIKTFPVISFSSMHLMRKEWLKSTLTGLLVLFASPFIGLLLLISGVGTPLLFILLALFLVVWLFSMAYPSFLLGQYLLSLAKQENSSDWIKLGVGYIILYLGFMILQAIPILGWALSGIISCFITSWAVGGLLLNKWYKVQARPGKR